MDRGKNLIRGSAVKSLSFVVSIIISFFLMPFLISSLGDRTYGIWTLVGTFLGYYGLLDIGLSSAVGRFISRAVGRNDADDVRRTISTSFYLFLGLGTFATLVTVLLTCSIGAFMKPTENLSLFRLLLLLLGVNFAFDFPVRAFNAVFSSNLREDVSMGITTVKTILCTLAIVYVIRRGYGIVGLAVVSVVFSVVDSLTRIFLSYKIDSRTTVSVKYFDKTKIRPLFNYSFFAFLGRIANILRFRLDQFVITAYVGLSAVTHYFVATRLVEYLITFISQMIGVVTPLFSQDEGRNDFEGIRRKFMFVSKLSEYVSIYFCGITLLYGKYFIERWMGPGYFDSTKVLWIFIIPISLQLIQSPVIPLLDGISKLQYYVYPNLVEGIINLILSLWLGKKYGMYGVALGTAIPMTIQLATVQPWYACKSINLNAKKYAVAVLTNCSTGVAVLAMGWLLVSRYVKADYPQIVSCITVQTLIYWPIVLFTGFAASERNLLFSFVRQAMLFGKRLEPAVS